MTETRSFSIEHYLDKQQNKILYLFRCMDGDVYLSPKDFMTIDKKTNTLKIDMESIIKKQFSMWSCATKKIIFDFHQWILVGTIPSLMEDQFYLLMFLASLAIEDSVFESIIKSNFGFHPIQNKLNWFYIHSRYANNSAKGCFNLHFMIGKLIEAKLICIEPGKEKKLNEQEVETLRLEALKKHEEFLLQAEKIREQRKKKYHEQKKTSYPPPSSPSPYYNHK